jgi:hypothetical protein
MSEPITLVDFLTPDFETLPVQLVAGIEATPELRGLQGLFKTPLSGIQWAALLQSAAGKVRELLQVPVTTILVRAWNDVREVRAALESTRQKPDATEIVALADHSIESEHKPHLELYENGQLRGRIVFPVSVEVELRGLLLEIAKGRIQRIRSGEVRIKGTLKVGDFTLMEKKFEPVRMPGALDFSAA